MALFNTGSLRIDGSGVDSTGAVVLFYHGKARAEYPDPASRSVYMTKEYFQSLDGRRRRAVEELKSLIEEHYPGTSFAVMPGIDDPETTHVVARVDLDDPDEVVDLVIERELALQIDEGIPVYVIPIRTPERTAALLRHSRQGQH